MSDRPKVIIKFSPKIISDEDLREFVRDGIQWELDEREREIFGERVGEYTRDGFTWDLDEFQRQFFCEWVGEDG